MAVINPSNIIGGLERLLSLGSGVFNNIMGPGPSKWTAGQTTWRVNNPQQVMVDVSYGQLLSVAANVPHLNVVISKGAEIFSSARFEHYDKDGNEIEDSPIVKFLQKPNPLQVSQNWLYEYYICKAVYGVAFGYLNYGGMKALSELPSFMWWLPPGLMKVNYTGKMYRQTDINGIVTSYELQGDATPFKTDEIMMVTTGITLNGITPVSPIVSLQIPLSNIMAALKSNNIILTERGQIGFIKQAPVKDVDGYLPPDKAEMTRIENQYQKDHSLNSRNGHVSFTTSNIEWVPMTFDVGQLKIYEGLEDAFGSICGRYNIDRDIFPSTKGATFENKAQALTSTIQNGMIPIGQELATHLMHEFGLIEKDERLELCWDHLPSMKEDELKEAQEFNQYVQGITGLVSRNIISPAQGKAAVSAMTDIAIDDQLNTSNPVVDKLAELSPLVANGVLSNLTINEVRQMVGLGNIEGGDQLMKLNQSNAQNQNPPSGQGQNN